MVCGCVMTLQGRAVLVQGPDRGRLSGAVFGGTSGQPLFLAVVECEDGRGTVLG
jgi:hypothetical protein